MESGNYRFLTVQTRVRASRDPEPYEIDGRDSIKYHTSVLAFDSDGGGQLFVSCRRGE